MLLRICFVFIIFIYAGCKSIQPEAPNYPAARKTFTRTTSGINIPVEIPLSIIEERLNKQFRGVLYDDDSYTRPTNDDVKIKVYQNNRIAVGASGDQLLFTVPLKIWAQARWKACSFCPEIEKQTIFDVEVYLKSKVEVLKNYQFRMTTSADGFEWKSAPTISLGPIDIPIARLLEGVLQKQLTNITKEIDKGVNSAVDLKSQISDLWNMAQNPILLDDSTKTWMVIEPRAIQLAPITSNKQNMLINLGLETFIETKTGTKPPDKPKSVLPDLKLTPQPANDFSINVQSILGFTEATAIAKRAVLGKTFAWKKKVVKVEDIEIYGKGDLAYIRLLLSGSAKGELFLFGYPKFDGSNNTLYFDQLDYDINTKSALIRAANWMVGSTIQKQLQNQLVFSFDNEVKGIRKDLETQLKKYSYKKLFTITGAITDFSIKDIYVADDHFDVHLNANGRASLKLDGIDF
jgi:hypothetical protein